MGEDGKKRMGGDGRIEGVGRMEGDGISFVI